MNFDDTPQEAEFRATARKWIDANAPKEYEAELSEVLARPQPAEKRDEILDVAKAWQKKKAEGGWACLHWPKEYGGRGATPIESVIWQQEEGVYGKLAQPFPIGQGMCGPTVMAYGSEDGQRRTICRSSPPARTSGVSCSPSPPAAPTSPACAPARRSRATTGSSTARRSGPPARIIPTTAFLITRTDPNVPKHKGLTMFFLDMKSKGVEVRPIKQANGMQEFNEVYFTDVRDSR